MQTLVLKLEVIVLAKVLCRILVMMKCVKTQKDRIVYFSLVILGHVT